MSLVFYVWICYLKISVICVLCEFFCKDNLINCIKEKWRCLNREWFGGGYILKNRKKKEREKEWKKKGRKKEGKNNL